MASNRNQKLNFSNKVAVVSFLFGYRPCLFSSHHKLVASVLVKYSWEQLKNINQINEKHLCNKVAVISTSARAGFFSWHKWEGFPDTLGCLWYSSAPFLVSYHHKAGQCEVKYLWEWQENKLTWSLNKNLISFKNFYWPKISKFSTHIYLIRICIRMEVSQILIFGHTLSKVWINELVMFLSVPWSIYVTITRWSRRTRKEFTCCPFFFRCRFVALAVNEPKWISDQIYRWKLMSTLVITHCW